MQTKFFTGVIEKSSDGDKDGTFILSTEDIDRDGDIILADGWRLDNFIKNPIALWQHDHKQPIGKWSNFRIEGKRLIADLKLAGTNLALMAKQLIDEGILKAVSVGFSVKEGDYEYRDPEKPYGGYLIKSAELLEASLVSVPANQNALMIGKALNLSAADLAVVFDAPPESFGKSADSALMDRVKGLLGKSADTLTPKPTSDIEDKPMKLSERIEQKQNELTALRDELTLAAEKYAEDSTDENQAAVEAFATKIEEAEKQLQTFQTAEKSIMDTLAKAHGKTDEPKPQAPGIIKDRKNPEAGELIFRQAAVKFISHVAKQSMNDVIRERYPNDKGLEAITKASTAPGDTVTSAWAAALLEEQVNTFVDLLANNSVYGALRPVGLSLNFAGAGSIKIPARTATATVPGAFVGEGNPIPVKELSFTSQTLTRHKMGVISTMTEELLDATNSQIEAIVRQAILDDTAKTLDTILMDNVAADAIRPAGLLNGVTPTASAGASAANIITDLKALLNVFNTDDAGKNLRIILNPQRLLGLGTAINAVGQMQFAEDVARGELMGVPLVVSANVATDEVHCVNAGEFATAYDGPAFSVSNTATLHMEDTAPEPIGTTGTPNVVAAPVRSLFQTDVMGIKMVLPVTWTMRRASQVSSLSGVAW